MPVVILPCRALLGIYVQAAICVFSGRPYDSHWETILKGLNSVTLFRLSLCSSEMFKVVMIYVRATQPESSSIDEVRVGGPNDRLSLVPTDVIRGSQSGRFRGNSDLDSETILSRELKQNRRPESLQYRLGSRYCNDSQAILVTRIADAG
ncbi:hypothetical protein C8F04DRAFT_1328170 [Mycena alexandri]|uniref:Uncharacterized protein n=1 Tax=Mycena alexandri TaxID=1745969 RepID=A0AAD6RZF0_9AGAR|nr:hypothetical protein C8F04DRAFT_1328170 [Mycena alexandri]